MLELIELILIHNGRLMRLLAILRFSELTIASHFFVLDRR